jgi:hypothetical protein
MFLATALTTLYFLTSPIAVPTSLETIQQHHLETAQGRLDFLNDKLTPYISAADQLNQEIVALSKTIKQLSPVKDHKKILSLTQELLPKMEKLKGMLYVLEIAGSVDDDFQQIDTILQQTEPLTPEQLEVVDRIASLCNSVDPAK